MTSPLACASTRWIRASRLRIDYESGRRTAKGRLELIAGLELRDEQKGVFDDVGRDLSKVGVAGCQRQGRGDVERFEVVVQTKRFCNSPTVRGYYGAEG